MSSPEVGGTNPQDPNKVDTLTQLEQTKLPDTLTANEPVGNYQDFAKRFPDLDKALKESIAQKIIKDLEKHQQRMKEINQEARR